jgi:hypothetical protein
MKRVLNRSAYFILALLLSLAGVAQDDSGKKLDVNINVDKGKDWYQQPWVWIAGGAVFILLLVALLRGGSRKEA